MVYGVGALWDKWCCGLGRVYGNERTERFFDILYETAYVTGVCGMPRGWEWKLMLGSD